MTHQSYDKQPHSFQLSYPAMASLRGYGSPHTTFRNRANALSRMSNPKFALTGAPLTREFQVDLSPRVYSELVSLCSRLGVPKESIGEMVACVRLD